MLISEVWRRHNGGRDATGRQQGGKGRQKGDTKEDTKGACMQDVSPMAQKDRRYTRVPQSREI